MLGKSHDNARALTLAEVKDVLTARSHEPEFGYEQQVCLDYANKFCKLSLEDAKKLEVELNAIEGMNPGAVAKITDLLPIYKTTLQLILAKEKLILDESKIDSILSLVKKAKKNEITPPPAPVEEKAGEGEEEQPESEDSQ
ncbi:MAG: DNA-directed RNA polymerase subunit F [Candidatus Micrarchaeia archaeon]